METSASFEARSAPSSYPTGPQWDNLSEVAHRRQPVIGNNAIDREPLLGANSLKLQHRTSGDGQAAECAEQ